MNIQILNAITGPEVIALVALLAANVILSIIAAIQKGEFNFRNLPDFIPTRVLPLIGYLVIAVLADVVGDWQAAAIAVYVGLVAMYSAGILAALKSLTGINLPDVLTEKK